MKVSVVIPVKNGEETLRECLEGIFAQKTDAALDLLVVDSGSTDATPEICRSFPLRRIVIDPRDFSHGDTRNLGASLTEGELIVFTVQDAVPADDRWLDRLIRNLIEDGEVAGAYSRTVPRPSCGPLVERGVKGDLNFRSERIVTRYPQDFAAQEYHPHTRRVMANFNDVASVIRRSVWERLPFQRTPFGEDILWADSALRAGHKIVFDPESVIVHSHEYRPGSIYPRTHIDAWFNQAYFGWLCVEKFRHVFVMAWRQFKEDRAFLKTRPLPPLLKIRETAVSLVYHFMEFLGFYMGGRVEGRLDPLRPVEAGTHNILLVAKEGVAPEECAEPVRILSSMGFEARLLSPKAGEEALERACPDLAHLLGFGPSTYAIAERCRERKIPFMVSLTDCWFRCPRKDLIRSDGALCRTRKPPGLGCVPCVAGHPEFIFPARTLNPLFRRGADAMMASRAVKMRALLSAAEYILVPDHFMRARCLEAGLDEAKVVTAGFPPLSPAMEGSMRKRCPGEGRLEEGGARLIGVKYRQVLSRVRCDDKNAAPD